MTASPRQRPIERDGLSSPSSMGDNSPSGPHSGRCGPARAIARPSRPPRPSRKGQRASGSSPASRLLASVRRLLTPKPLPLGARGERHAASYLRRQGFRILGRNVRVAPGEADLVALDPDRLTIVIVEVKTRLLSGDHPPPEASITAHKRRKLHAVAQAVVRRGKWQSRPIRIDVIAIDWPVGKTAPVLRHRRAAV